MVYHSNKGCDKTEYPETPVICEGIINKSTDIKITLASGGASRNANASVTHGLFSRVHPWKWGFRNSAKTAAYGGQEYNFLVRAGLRFPMGAIGGSTAALLEISIKIFINPRPPPSLVTPIGVSLDYRPIRPVYRIPRCFKSRQRPHEWPIVTFRCRRDGRNESSKIPGDRFGKPVLLLLLSSYFVRFLRNHIGFGVT